MSVTQYTIGCGYELLKLKDTVYFLSKTQLKTINIDNGEAYVVINESVSPNRLKGFNVKLTETESLDERYVFTKQLTMSITGHLTDSTFLLDDDYYIVVQTEDGTYYLVNVDFPSKMSFVYNLSEGQDQTDFTFVSNSNHPTLKLNWNPTSYNDCSVYQTFGIDSIKLLEKDYTSIDSEGKVINLFDGNEFKNIDYLKNTISLQENYDGKIATTTISFEIPFDNYKPSWQYNLLEFTQNLYTAHITPKSSESGIFCGYEHGLQPSYEINGNTSIGESTSIKITLVEASEWGIFELDTWSYYRDNSKRWVGIDSEVKCIGLGVGINTLMQEVDGNGTPTQRYKCLEGYESAYTNYNIITSYTESDVESFRTSVCTRFRARGGAPTGYYTCINGDKYELLVTSISYDGGKAWINSDDYTVGEMVESASSFCEIEPEYEWRLGEEWDCRPQLERWIPSGTTCVGVDKYDYSYKQVSDDGVVWYNPSPMEWSATTLIQAKSEECGFSARTLTTATTCLEYDLYSVNEYQESYDFGQTWLTVSSSTGTLIEEDSEDCGYHPPRPSGEYKFYGINENGGVVVDEYDITGTTCGDNIIHYNPLGIFICNTDYNKFMYFGDYVINTIQENPTSSNSGSTKVRYIDFNELLQSFTFNFYSSPINRVVLPNNLRSCSLNLRNCQRLSEIVFPETLINLSLVIRPYSTTSVPKLKRLTIPKNVSHFEGLPMDNDNRTYESVEEIYFESKIPPQIIGDSSDSLNDHIKSSFTTKIYVPQESVNLYKQAWEPQFKYDNVDKTNLIQGYNCTADTGTYTDSFKSKITENGVTTTIPKGTSRVYYQITSATSRIEIGDSVKALYIHDTRESGGTIPIYFGGNVKDLRVWHSNANTKSHTQIMSQLPNGLLYCDVGGTVLPSGTRPSSIIEENLLGQENFANAANAKIVFGGTDALEDTTFTKSVTIGDSVRILGGFNGYSTDAYHHTGVTSISSVTIGSNVGYIYPNTFKDCTSLSSVTITATNPPILGDGAFDGTNCPIYVPCGSLAAYKSANNWSSFASRMHGISPCTEYRWTQSGTTCIGYDKYQNNIKEQSTDGGATWTVVTPVEYSASTLIQADSQDCGYVPPASNTRYKFTFNDSSVVYGECNSSSAVTTADTYNYRLSTLVSVEIGDCVTSIGDSAFYSYNYSCINLTSVTMSDNITSIDADAFNSCSALTSINMPSGLTYIGNYAFVDCKSLTTIDIPDSVTSIGNSAFSGCSSFTSVTIPDSVTNIPMSFASCTSLTSVTIGSGVTRLDGTFYGCTSLASVTIPNTVTSLDGTFYGCTSLTSVAIGSGVTSLGANAFRDCASLTSITIPDSVTSIGESAFSSCSALTSVTCLRTTPPTLSNYVFNNTNNCPIYVPAASVDTYKTANKWKNYASRITAIP